MEHSAGLNTQAWEAFYVVVGSTAGALTGLQFVVLTLISEAGMMRGTTDALSAFTSPNIVHFSAALLVSAVFSAPWVGVAGPGVAALLVGVAGLVYSVEVMSRARRQRDYRPVLEDWIWHAALPLFAYGTFVLAGVELLRSSADGLFIVGGATLMLVFIGLHNAWDTVTYVMVRRTREKMGISSEARERGAPKP